MANVRISVAAATAVVDYDLMQDQRLQSVAYNRRLHTMKVTGSAAVSDTLIDLFIGEDYVGRYANTATGEGNSDDEQALQGVACYAGGQIHEVVIDAPTTHPIILNINYSR